MVVSAIQEEEEVVQSAAQPEPIQSIPDLELCQTIKQEKIEIRNLSVNRRKVLKKRRRKIKKIKLCGFPSCEKEFSNPYELRKHLMVHWKGH